MSKLKIRMTTPRVRLLSLGILSIGFLLLSSTSFASAKTCANVFESTAAGLRIDNRGVTKLGSRIDLSASGTFGFMPGSAKLLVQTYDSSAGKESFAVYDYANDSFDVVRFPRNQLDYEFMGDLPIFSADGQLFATARPTGSKQGRELTIAIFDSRSLRTVSIEKSFVGASISFDSNLPKIQISDTNNQGESRSRVIDISGALRETQRSSKGSFGLVAREWHSFSSKNVGNEFVSSDGRYHFELNEAGNVFTVTLNQPKTFIAEIKHDWQDIDHLVISPDGRYVATSGSDATAKVLELQTGIELLQVPHDTKSEFYWSPDSRGLVVTKSYGAPFVEYELGTKNILKSWPAAAFSDKLHFLAQYGHQSSPSAASRQILTSGPSYFVFSEKPQSYLKAPIPFKIEDRKTGQILWTGSNYFHEFDFVMPLTMSEKAGLVGTVQMEGPVIFLVVQRMRDGSVIGKFDLGTDLKNVRVAFSDDGKLIAMRSRQQGLVVIPLDQSTR